MSTHLTIACLLVLKVFTDGPVVVTHHSFKDHLSQKMGTQPPENIRTYAEMLLPRLVFNTMFLKSIEMRRIFGNFLK